MLCRVEHALLNCLIEQSTKTTVLVFGIDCNAVKIDKALIAFGKPLMIGAGMGSIRRKRDTEGANFTVFVVYR